MPVGDFLSFRRENFTIILNGDDCDRGNGICKTFTTFHGYGQRTNVTTALQ